MAKKFWWPKRIPAQLQLVQTFRAKFPEIAPQLGFAPAEITDALNACDSIIKAIQHTYRFAANARATTAWRNIVLYGRQRGASAGEPPEILMPEPFDYIEGSVDIFFALRDRILSSREYTESVGAALGLIGPEKTKLAEEETAPDLTITVAESNMVHLAGSMKGCNALRVEYAPEGGDFSTVAFLTSTPHGFQLTTSKPGTPEKGAIRAIFLKRNKTYGQYSPSYPIGLW